MSFQWQFDAPSGVYKNHTLSSKIREAAIAKTKMMQFVDPEPGYGKNRGENITINRIANISEPTNGRISESQRIPEDEFTITTVSITVSEWGRSVPFTSFAQDLSAIDLENRIQRKLRDQMKLTLDTGAADAFKNAQVKFIPTGSASGVFDTDGTASTTATSNMKVYHVEQIRDYLYTTLNTPPFMDDDYVGLVSTKAKRGLISDPAWEEWHKYTNPSAKFNGEIGRIENIRFIEINHTNALSGSLGSGGVLGEALVFGEDAVAMAVAEDPELRVQIPQDYGRQKAVAWYGILDFGLIWDTANSGEARVVHVTSA